MYRDRVTGKYPVSASEIKTLRPHASVPDILTASALDFLGFDAVFVYPLPNLTSGQTVREVAPLVMEDGNYYQQWEVIDCPQISASHSNLAISVNTLIEIVQRRLDDFAASRNYDNILSLCTYATSKDPIFSAEGQRGVDLRDATWRKCYDILEEINRDEKQIPDIDTVLSELPVLSWV
jgi:hypothetical protein